MSILESFLTNFSSPIILCFLLGLFARIVKSDLTLPEQLYASISIYLLLAIGLKGGVQLSKFEMSELAAPLLVTIVVSIATTSIAFCCAKFIGKMDTSNAAALAAHFGSVSAVTFMAALGFLDKAKVVYPGYMTAIFAVMEIPAILLAVGIYALKKKSDFKKTLHEVISGKTTVLLAGGIAIGYIAGQEHTAIVMPLFTNLFYGVLTFFLLEMGLIVGDKIKDIPKVGLFLLIFSIVVPIVNGFLGVAIASFAGMSLGGATIFGVLASSASYIAAPAAVRVSIPEANPAYYITSSLAITFPFNITLGIPLYFWFAKSIFNLV